MANKGQPVTYRPGVNRAITKKWAEAKAINYDDWDEDDGYDPDEPVQAAPAHSRQQSWDTRSQGSQGYYASNRSVTSPPSPGRPSFDRGDERRHFSNIGGAQGPYPTAQRDPFEEIQHDQPYDPQMRGHRNQPSLQLRTGGGRLPMDQGQYHQGPYTATGPPRGDQFQDPRGAPFSAPIIGHSGRRSHSSGRPVPDEIYPRGETPMRPGSQNSQGRSPTRAFPPRKSSLSQQQPPPEIQQYVVAGVAPVAQTPAPLTEGKALPFIRPADIYRRVEEEREKERRSQESSRPSFESAASRIRESSVASHRTGTDAPGDQRAPGDSADEADTTRRLQPTLPPVAERKSEYGFDNMVKNAEPNESARALDRTDTGLSKTSEPLSASSDYTSRADPTSASTLNSRQSPFDALAHGSHESSLPAPPEAPFLLPAVRGVSDFSNDMFGSHSSPSLLPASQPSSTMTGHRGENMAAIPVPGSNLQHQNSLGYRSMVNQAFDQSQDQVPPTPISMSESVARSNSASASDISPIMSRNYEPPTSQPPIPEETNSRPGTSGTQGSLSRVATDKDLPVPPWFVPGYRRDSSPSTSENPDRRPLSLESSEMPKAEHGNLSAATSSTASWDKDSHRDDEDVKTDQPAPQSAGALSHLEQPSLLTRTTSEDWREWETSRKQFKTQHGVQESVPSTGIPSPISRAESPAKGTVKDIAGKLENSGRNSPANLEPARPSNTRLESFRPSLPGGWQSYTTNTGAATPQPEDRLTEAETTQPQVDDDIPTAGPPRDYTDFNAPSKSAFAAAAAAGTALAGAFGVSQVLGSNDHDEQRETSVGNSRTSTSNSSYERETDEPPISQDRQLESIPEGDHRSPTSPLPPTPLSKDTPTEAGAGQSTLDYFPAPLSLHQSRGSDQLTPQRPAFAPSLSSDVNLQDDENDRLRKEIVKSLTPKSSEFEDNSRLSPGQNDFPATSGSQRTVSTMGDSNLPKEYDSYWSESNNDVARNSAFEAATPNVPPVPETFEATTPKVPPIPETKGIISSADGDLPQKPLEQRFSWETAGEQTPPASMLPRIDALGEHGSPDTIRAPTSAPALPDPISSSEALRPAPSVNVAENKQLPPLVSMRGALLSEQAPIAPKSSFRERPMKDVLALNSPQERIQVFNAHRQHFAATEDGGLAQWLQSIGRAHPEHSTVMSANGVPTLQDDGTELHRPSPARLATKFRNISMPSSSYSGGGEASGTKQAVEDGKRLLHVAGKFGKKGGTTAKGLLAKGKDKLRTVSSSAGDKVN